MDTIRKSIEKYQAVRLAVFSSKKNGAKYKTENGNEFVERLMDQV